MFDVYSTAKMVKVKVEPHYFYFLHLLSSLRDKFINLKRNPPSSNRDQIVIHTKWTNEPVLVTRRKENKCVLMAFMLFPHYAF